MSTTTTAPAVIDALLAVDITDVESFESWPGLDAAQRALVLGAVTWDGDEGYRIATIKAARKQRQEVYDIGFELFIMGDADSTPANPKPIRDLAFADLAAIENALAEDVTAAVAGGFATVQWIEVKPTEAGPVVFERAWAYRIKGAFKVNARLH